MSLLASVLNTSPSSWRSHFDAALSFHILAYFYIAIPWYSLRVSLPYYGYTVMYGTNNNMCFLGMEDDCIQCKIIFLTFNLQEYNKYQ